MILSEYPSPGKWETLLKRPAADVAQLEEKVSAIMHDVRMRGDEALLDYALKFDGVQPEGIAVRTDEMDAAERSLGAELRSAIMTAKSNIEKFHRAQEQPLLVVETMPGVTCSRKSIPVEKAGLYIPGGTAPLFSTILMLAVPASIAGCREIILCTPPSKDGTIHPAILFTAKACGITSVFCAGGAQAVAAMAYGTQTIPRVDKIFGPGNAWVTCAKQLAAKEGIAIDLPAGPSELAVYADEHAPPAFVAADLLSQAEHGPDSQVVVVSTRREVLGNILREVETQLALLPRKETAERSLAKSHAILLENEEQVMKLMNAYAPEHLILACGNADALADKVINAGSVFLGIWSPESAGDYASGTNHTLPTSGYARAWSGVSVDSFMKKVTFQKLTREGLEAIGPVVETMAEAEGLFAHKNAVRVRLGGK
ncbi:MAG TPA: histidinol dehydrogenase [Bacteroidia bacterium]|nr:histidinol dehydrogenase [Bacteroidia bacterium]